MSANQMKIKILKKNILDPGNMQPKMSYFVNNLSIVSK